MKKKLKLNDLNVASFVTDVNSAKGGLNIADYVSGLYCNSIHECPTIPLDRCQTMGGGCPTVNVACPTLNGRCATIDRACPTVDIACGTDPIRGCIDTKLCGVIAINM